MTDAMANIGWVAAGITSMLVWRAIKSSAPGNSVPTGKELVDSAQLALLREVAASHEVKWTGWPTTIEKSWQDVWSGSRWYYGSPDAIIERLRNDILAEGVGTDRLSLKLERVITRDAWIKNFNERGWRHDGAHLKEKDDMWDEILNQDFFGTVDVVIDALRTHLRTRSSVNGSEILWDKKAERWHCPDVPVQMKFRLERLVTRELPQTPEVRFVEVKVASFEASPPPQHVSTDLDMLRAIVETEVAVQASKHVTARGHSAARA